MFRTTMVAFALVSSVLMVAGCGESSKKGETKTSTVTTSTTSNTSTDANASVPPVTVKPASGKPLVRARWIVKGDAICARTNIQVEALHVKVAAELPRILPQSAAYERAEVVALSKLVPPAAYAGDWQKFLTTTLQMAEGSDKLATLGRYGDSIMNTPLASTVTRIHERAMSIAKHSGFKACSM